MAGRAVFFVNASSFEHAFQAASLCITAAAMGDEVYVIFGFDALRALHRNAFGLPHSEREAAESARAQGLGVPAPAKMLAEARAMGARFLACDTTVKLCGLTAEDFEQRLDEVVGLPSLWRLTEGARVVCL